MEGERGVTQSIIDELHCSDIRKDQIEFESGVTRSNTNDLHSWHIEGDQMKG